MSANNASQKAIDWSGSSLSSPTLSQVSSGVSTMKVAHSSLNW
jgi:hypothetical protein